MFIKLFNVQTDQVEYVRTNTIAHVLLYIDDGGPCIVAAKKIGTEDDNEAGYYVKVFGRREDFEEDADVKMPKDFYVYVKRIEEAAEKADEFLKKYMKKHFRVLKTGD